MKTLKVSLLLIVAGLFLSIFAYADDLKVDNGKYDEQNVKVLNQLGLSLFKTANYNNRAALEEEYDLLNNDLKLDSIPDKKLVEIIRQLMDTLTKFRINEAEMQRLQKAYQQFQEERVMRTLMSGGLALASAAGVKIQGSHKSTPNWAKAAGLIASYPSISISMSKSLNDGETLRQIMDDRKFQLDKEKLESLNGLRTSFIDTYWEFLRNSNVPDEKRITEDQIKSLLKENAEKDPARRYRLLVALEKECGNVPTYWYYRADAAYDTLESENSQDNSNDGTLKADIARCLARYRELSGMLRKDSTLASLLMLHLATADLSPEQAKQEINEIIEQFPMDTSKRLFAALTSRKYGLDEDAIAHLNVNLDKREYETVSRKLLAEIYEDRHDEQAMTSLITKLIKEASATNQEILYYIGHTSKAGAFFNSIKPELGKIKMGIDSSFIGKDSIVLILPLRWQMIDKASKPEVLTILNSEFYASKIKVEKEGIIITFKNVIDTKTLSTLPDHKLPITVELNTRHFPIIMSGILEPSEDALNKAKVKAIKDKKKLEDIKISASDYRFKLQKIVCGDSWFQRDGMRWTAHRKKQDNS